MKPVCASENFALFHHVWLLNSIVHGFGQSGVQMHEGDYHYAIHNVFYDNSNVQCDAQGLDLVPGKNTQSLDIRRQQTT